MNKTQEQLESIQWLKDRLTPGDAVYAIIRHVSGSGMSRNIDFKLIRPNHENGPAVWVWHASYHVAKALGWRLNKDGSVRVTGCGMDMIFHTVYCLSQTLFGDGYKLSAERL